MELLVGNLKGNTVASDLVKISPTYSNIKTKHQGKETDLSWKIGTGATQSMRNPRGDVLVLDPVRFFLEAAAITLSSRKKR